MVILDEAHERTVQTDILFGVVKGAQTKRVKAGLHPLKVSEMSSTSVSVMQSPYCVSTHAWQERPNHYLLSKLFSLWIEFLVVSFWAGWMVVVGKTHLYPLSQQSSQSCALDSNSVG